MTIKGNVLHLKNVDLAIDRIEELEKENAELSNSVTELTNSVFELENKVTELEKQIERMKCCGNCEFKVHKNCEGTVWMGKEFCDKWELAE